MTKVTEKPVTPDVEIAEVIFALQKGGAVRYPRLEIIPAGVKVLTTGELEDMKLKELGELYWELTGAEFAPKPKSRQAAVFTIVDKVLSYPMVEEAPPEPEPEPEPVVKAQKGRYGPPVRTPAGGYRLKTQKDESMLKMSPQCAEVLKIVIEEVLRTNCDVIPQARMIELMEQEKPRLHTRQSSWRIFSYYKSTLISRGLLQEIA